MALIKLTIAILLPLLLGGFGLAALLKERLAFFAYLERLALAWGTGVWLLIFIMFCLPFANIPLSFQNISLTAALILIGLAPFSLKHLSCFRPKALPRLKSSWSYLLVILLILKIFFVFWSSLLKPIIGPDLLTCYGLLAKHTFIHQLPLYLYNEPPLPFLIASWTPTVLGAWQDNLLALPFALMYPCLIVIFFYSLRRYLAEASALFFTFLMASLPLLLFHAGTAYADFPQAFYYSIATLYLFRFIKDVKTSRDKAYSYLLVSMLFLGISIWAKKSGLYYAGVNLSVLISFLAFQWKNIPKKAVLLAVLIPLLIGSPWLIYDQTAILRTSLSEALPSLERAASTPELFLRDMSWVVIFSMARNMFLKGNWQLLWALFFSLLVLYPKRAFRSPLVYLNAIVLLNLAALFVIYRFTGAFPNIMDDTQLNRFMLHFAPVVLYFCAELIATRGLRPSPPTPEARSG